MATATPLLTIEQYLRTSYSPDADFIGGEIQERNVGEFDHGFIQGLIFSWFLEHRSEFGALPVIEQRIRIDETSVRICDVAVVRTGHPREQVATTPPFICIEVLSPEDRLMRAEKVLADYLAMGVKSIWLIDPVGRAGHYYDESGLHLAHDNVLSIEGTTIKLNVETMFAQLDETNA